jgi:multidrug efflux pump subunit AcrA (membrane-fusion protein)
MWIGTGIAMIAVVAAWLKHSPHANAKPTSAASVSVPRVMVSKPLIQNVDTSELPRPIFGRFASRDTRAGGGALTGIFFRDGDIVHKGDLLLTIDPQPYEIALAQATAQLGVAMAHLELAERQLGRAKDLRESDAGTVENVDQRTGDERAALASVEGAKARIRDAV